MTTHQPRGNRDAPIMLGGLLVLAGAAAFAMQGAGVHIGDLVGAGGWPFFVIVPGLLLLLAAFVATPPRGIGFAIAGSIVTTVGLILLYQNTTGAWESWAYVWALIPGAVGVAMVVYGAIASDAGLLAAGTRMATISAVPFVVGLWFFGPVFTDGRLPVDLDAWWPIALVAVGALLLVSALIAPRGRTAGPRDVDGAHPA